MSGERGRGRGRERDEELNNILQKESQRDLMDARMEGERREKRSLLVRICVQTIRFQSE